MTWQALSTTFLTYFWALIHNTFNADVSRYSLFMTVYSLRWYKGLLPCSSFISSPHQKSFISIFLLTVYWKHARLFLTSFSKFTLPLLITQFENHFHIFTYLLACNPLPVPKSALGFYCGCGLVTQT